MKVPLNAITSVIDGLLRTGAHTATKYLAENQIVRATRKMYSGRPSRSKVEIVLQIAKPNFLERKFVKLCKKAGEPFPVQNIQYKNANR